MVDNSRNKKEKPEDLGENISSTEKILKEIGSAVNKEKKRREKLRKQGQLDVYHLSSEELISSEEVNFDAPMPYDLATLKSLIQIIVREELKRNQKD